MNAAETNKLQTRNSLSAQPRTLRCPEVACSLYWSSVILIHAVIVAVTTHEQVQTDDYFPLSAPTVSIR
jgi:hypothetical protein